MASQSQIHANRRNAERSTGPRTPAGKASVAQNGVRHGLSSSKFALLPWENPAEFDELLTSLAAEHQPSTPTESFLVTEMARAQWKLNRVAHIEHELPAGEDGASGWSELASNWDRDCTHNQKLQKLERYETSLRRAWYRALNTLLKLRAPSQHATKSPALQNDKANPIEEASPSRNTLPAAAQSPAAKPEAVHDVPRFDHFRSPLDAVALRTHGIEEADRENHAWSAEP